MKVKMYNFALTGTTVLLNTCIVLKQWKYAEKIVSFRKNHIAKKLRACLIKFK
jgi:hypothetical protein